MRHSNRFDGAPPLRYVRGVEQDSASNDDKEHAWHRLERALPDLIRRAVELGYDKLTEGPENVRHFVNELRLPKEVLQVMLAQIDETKQAITRSVAREVRDFLERSDVSDTLARALTRLSLEIRTEVRFVSQDGATKPEVRSTVRLDADREAQPSTGPSEPAEKAQEEAQ